MKRFLLKLLPFECYELQTKLSKDRILNTVKTKIDPYGDYRSRVSEDGFCVAEKNHKSLGIGNTHNSFAPVAHAKVRESDGLSTVSVNIRMNLIVQAIFLPLYVFSVLAFVFAIANAIVYATGAMDGAEYELASLTLLLMFPIMQLLMYFAFKRPAKRLRKFLDELILWE